jgi:hypothetical protein
MVAVTRDAEVGSTCDVRGGCEDIHTHTYTYLYTHTQTHIHTYTHVYINTYRHTYIYG